jgi:hypothetical protein
MSWKTQEVSPQQVIAEEQPTKVRVTRTDGLMITVKEPAVSGDSIVGVCTRLTGPGGVEGDPIVCGQSVSIPLASVAKLEVSSPNTGASIGLAGALAVAAAGVLLVIGLNIEN